MEEPKVHRVEMWICELCLSGKGGICNVPGCALCRNTAPDIPVIPEFYTILDDTCPQCHGEKELAIEMPKFVEALLKRYQQEKGHVYQSKMTFTGKCAICGGTGVKG